MPQPMIACLGRHATLEHPRHRALRHGEMALSDSTRSLDVTRDNGVDECPVLSERTVEHIPAVRLDRDSGGNCREQPLREHRDLLVAGSGRHRIVDGRVEGGYTDMYELICPSCGDRPDLDYLEISPRLQWLRGPYRLEAALAVFHKHQGVPWPTPRWEA